ncbi:hypothetical protein J5TS1_12690 [Bacillus licheniformis]|nr:hypothetical protein J31TS2_23880 [Bacillus licheniformis]GIN30347.1 hypothetical protein J2TS5_23860 [Bacillus licheniformis]GIN33766.1 hypothetical protein J5TS1_12690 [Bacillus licheniformis]
MYHNATALHKQANMEINNQQKLHINKIFIRVSDYMLKLQNISKEYPQSNFSMKNLEFTCGRNQIIGLLGKNGAGKTTLLEIIAGLIPPDSGEVVVDGHLTNYLEKIGYLEDDPKLFENLTCYELIKYQSLLIEKPLSQEQIIETLDMFSLKEQKDQMASSLSRGMRQRMSFILSTLHQPDVILLDEPFTGLDPKNMADMKKILINIRNQNRIIILSTHILQFAADLCDEILFINNGNIIHTEKKLAGETFNEASLEKKFLEYLC